MNFFKYITQNWIKHEKKVLGRWNIDYCDVKMSKKIDLSNEEAPLNMEFMLVTLDTSQSPMKSLNAEAERNKEVISVT